MEMDGPDSEMDGSMSNNEDELSDLHDEDSDEHLGISRHAEDGEADILSKLKQQVRNMDRDREEAVATVVGNGAASRDSAASSPFGSHPQFSLPLPFSFPHPAAAAAAAAFLPPVAPYPAVTQPTHTSSGSSHSSDSSNSSQQQTWSFEEQFKQVRQLYEISDDPKRKEFLDDLFSFMQKRGTPINRLPIMAKSVLDLYELYNLVIARGGLVDVINKKLWQEIIKGLHLPSSITSAAFTLRTQYMKYLYPYECEKRRLSTPSELQAAIDGNRREGRRTSYGSYPDLMRRSPGPQHHPSSHPSQHLPQQMSPLGLGPLGLRPSQLNGNINGNSHLPHPALHPALAQPPLAAGPVPSIAPSDFEARMVEYVRFLNKELKTPIVLPNSPPSSTSPREALNALEMSRLTLWNLYNNNNPPTPEPQKEALNLGIKEDSKHVALKREQPDLGDGPPLKKPRTIEEEEKPKEANVSDVSRNSGNGAHIRISSSVDGSDREGSITVSMEINGTMYQGVLFAQSTRSH